jgi:hypothetical protein
MKPTQLWEVAQALFCWLQAPPGWSACSWHWPQVCPEPPPVPPVPPLPPAPEEPPEPQSPVVQG